MREKACTATRERIISYGREDIVKRFSHLDFTFINILCIFTLVNNLYSVSCLCRCGWEINMKHAGETTFTISNKIIGYVDEIQGEYVMSFMDHMPKLHALAKPTKDFRTWHNRVAHLGYKNLICISKYVFGMEKVADPVPNKICG